MLTALLLSSLALPALAAPGLVGKHFIKYDIKAKRVCTGLTKATGNLAKLHGRQLSSDLTKQQDGTSYTIQLGVGSPAQPVEVQLDTGSSDLWVNPNCANAGSQVSIDFCNSLPRFDSTKSTSFVDLGSSYTLVYGGGSATIEWVTDDVTIGGSEVQAQRFGVATNGDREPFGILGVGPKTFSSQPDYPYFIDTLAAQGFTQSRAFGLDIRSIDAADGSIIFGGLDRGKYIGNLEKLAIIPESNDGTRYWVSLGGIDLVKDGASTSISSSSIPVLLDSGSTLTYLPQDVYAKLGESFPTAELHDQSGYYIVDCAVAQQKGSVNFKFGGKTVKVQYKDFVWIVNAQDNLCILGAEGVPAGANPQRYILGDSFLRAAYLVFDQDNHNIHLAQGANCGSEIVAIGKGAGAVPSVAGLCPPPADDTTSSTSSTSTASSTSSTTSSYTPTGFPNGTYTPPHTTKYPTSSEYPATSTDHPLTPYPTNTYQPYPTGSPYPTGKDDATYTWTYYSTTCYTVTECPKTKTDCPVGHYTTETYTSYSTYCPATETGKPYPTGTGKPHPEYPTKDQPEQHEYPTEGDKPEQPEYPTGGKEAEKPYPTGDKKAEYPKTTLGTAVAVPVTTATYKPVVTAGVGRMAANAGLALVVAAVAALL